MLKQGKAVAILKEGRENKIYLETPEKMMFEHLELYCGWMVRKESSADKKSPSQILLFLKESLCCWLHEGTSKSKYHLQMVLHFDF